MLSRLELLVDLLHSAAEASLATLSVAVPGYPFASMVPFVTDEHHCPLFLISSLAEHTKNLLASPRASLLIARSLGDGEMARVSLVGDVKPCAAAPLLVARYLRYHPAAERFLQLGDFHFHRFVPVRVLTVGGFAKANWLEGKRLFEAPHFALESEAKEIQQIEGLLPPGMRLLGIDGYGADVETAAGRQRIRFGAGPVLGEASMPSLMRELEAFSQRNKP